MGPNTWAVNSASETVVIFVHGILSSSRECWQNRATKTSWPEIVRADTAFDDASVFMADYPTGLDVGEFDVYDAADELIVRLRNGADRFSPLQKRKLLFVCHSQGGLVVRQMLVSHHAEFAAKRIGLVLCGSPSLGSVWATFASPAAWLLNLRQAINLAANSSTLKALDRDFQRLRDDGRIPELFGISLLETRGFAGMPKIVSGASGSRHFSDWKSIPKSNHQQIVKPDGPDHASHLHLRDFSQRCGFIPPRQVLPSVDPTKSEYSRGTLIRKYPLLAGLVKEAEGPGIANATLAAVLASRIPATDLAQICADLACKTDGQVRFGIACLALKLADKHNVAKDVVEFCLAGNNLEKLWRESLASEMALMQSEAAISWCHRLLTSQVRDDLRYYYFLERHLNYISKTHCDEMVAYLLLPYRGPAHHLVESFLKAIPTLSDPEPLLIRWKDWIRDGFFDPQDLRPGEGESGRLLYGILNEVIARNIAVLMPLVRATEMRLHLELKSSNPRVGLYHLVCMILARYRRLNHIAEDVLTRVYADQMSNEQRRLFSAISDALNCLPGDHDGWNSPQFRSLWRPITMMDGFTAIYHEPVCF